MVHLWICTSCEYKSLMNISSLPAASSEVITRTNPKQNRSKNRHSNKTQWYVRSMILGSFRIHPWQHKRVRFLSNNLRIVTENNIKLDLLRITLHWKYWDEPSCTMILCDRKAMGKSRHEKKRGIIFFTWRGSPCYWFLMLFHINGKQKPWTVQAVPPFTSPFPSFLTYWSDVCSLIKTWPLPAGRAVRAAHPQGCSRAWEWEAANP